MVLIAVGAVALLVGCSRGAGVQHFAGRTMGTGYNVKYAGDVAVAPVRSAVEEELEAVNGRFSTYLDGSEISRFNVHGSTEPFAVSAPFAELVRRSLELAVATDGAFDPTVKPLVDIWPFGPAGDHGLPDDTAVAAALARVGHQKLAVVDGDRLVKSVPDLTLDLNAIAKGHGVDRLGFVLQRLGLDAWMVEIGGEVRCRGTKPDGQPWRIGIERPDAGAPLGVDIEATVELRDEAMATSGSYRQFVEHGGKRAYHIFDPRTGRSPEQHVVSVSVIAADCTTADALATAFMVLGPDAAARVLERMPGATRVLFLLDDGDGKLRHVPLRWSVAR